MNLEIGRYLRGLWRAVLAALLALFLADLLKFAGTTGLIERNCGNDLLSEVAAPDGRSKAVVFLRVCDGRAFTTDVSIVAPTDVLDDDPGNALRLDDNPQRRAYPSGAIPLSVRWTSSKELLIVAPGNPRMLSHSILVGDQVVRYEHEGH